MLSVRAYARRCWCAAARIGATTAGSVLFWKWTVALSAPSSRSITRLPAIGAIWTSILVRIAVSAASIFCNGLLFGTSCIGRAMP